MNENFKAVQAASLFGVKNSLTVAMVFAYYGGIIGTIGAFSNVADGTVNMAISSTNYIESTTAGVVSCNQVGFTAGRVPLYVATTDTVGILTLTDYRVFMAAYAGLTNANHADNETPTGAITGTDGTDGNDTFTLAAAPVPVDSLQLFKTDVGTGVLMIKGIHYNLAGLTITYTNGNKPIGGGTPQTHRAWYRHA